MNPTSFPRLFDPSCSQAPAPEQSSLEQAYERVRERIATLPDDQRVHLNVDLPAAVSTVQTAVLRMRPYLPTMLALPHVDTAELERLTDYAHATAYVHALYTRPESKSDPLAAMYSEALVFRAALLDAGRLLVRMRLAPASLVEKAGTVVGYRNVAYELVGLTTELLAILPSVSGRLPLDEEQVRRARQLGEQLLLAVGERGEAERRTHSLAQERSRAFSRMTRAYAEARRALTFLRWHEGDVESLAPSLFHGRRSRAADGEGDVEAGTEGVASDEPSAAGDALEPSVTPSSANDTRGESVLEPLGDEAPLAD